MHRQINTRTREPTTITTTMTTMTLTVTLPRPPTTATHTLATCNNDQAKVYVVIMSLFSQCEYVLQHHFVVACCVALCCVASSCRALSCRVAIPLPPHPPPFSATACPSSQPTSSHRSLLSFFLSFFQQLAPRFMATGTASTARNHLKELHGTPTHSPIG